MSYHDQGNIGVPIYQVFSPAVDSDSQRWSRVWVEICKEKSCNNILRMFLLGGQRFSSLKGRFPWL